MSSSIFHFHTTFWAFIFLSQSLFSDRKDGAVKSSGWTRARDFTWSVPLAL